MPNCSTDFQLQDKLVNLLEKPYSVICCFLNSLTAFSIIKYKVLVFFLGIYREVLLILEISLSFIQSMIIIWGFEKYFLSL